MNCLDFRRKILAVPDSTGEEVRVHEESCAACRQFRRDIKALDQNLYEAFKVDVPPGLTESILEKISTPRPRRRYWLAAAASLLVAMAITMFFQLRDPMGEALVAHLELEADFIAGHIGAVENSRIRQVLNKIDTRVEGPVPDMIFADNCIMDGKLIAHFVVEEDGQQYTVLLVPYSQLKREVSFDHAGWRGIVRPHQAGGLAVLGEDDNASGRAMDAIADRYARSLVKQGV